MDDMQLQFEQELNTYYKNMENRISELFKQAIQENVYDYYASPRVYERTYTFINSVKVHLDLESGQLYVYNDLNDGSSYYSVVDGSSQYQNISHWIESGHEDSTGIANQYHTYEGRRYLERAKELIMAEFPELEIEIIDNEEI